MVSILRALVVLVKTRRRFPTGQVNGLLEPVRKHFSEDAEAKRILAQITEWMQEPKSVRASPLRRLNALDETECAVAVVFAPLPTAQPTVGAAADVLRCLATAPNSHKR
eukprot:4954614-Pleurochrysis_carterae.AAC.1